MPPATPQGSVQGQPPCHPEAGTQPSSSALQPTESPAACPCCGRWTPSPCRLARPARPPSTPACDVRDTEVSQTATAACGHRPADWSRDSRSGAEHPHTPRLPWSRPRRPSGERLVPEGNPLSKPHGLALSPDGQEPRSHTGRRGCTASRPPAPRGAEWGTRLPGANAGAGHGRSRVQASGAAQGRRRLPETALVREAGRRPRHTGLGLSPSPSRRGPLWARPHPHGPTPTPAPSRPLPRAAAAHVGPATAGLTRLHLRLPA